MLERARLRAIVDGFTGRRVVLYGDLVLDRFVLGAPKRISREAPVIILRFEGQRDIPGGGANALANIASLGGTALPVGVVGDDEPGHALLAALRARGVDVSSILIAPGFRTVTKVRVVAGGPSSLKHQVARYDIEDRLAANDRRLRRVLATLGEVGAQAAAAAVSDYGYGVVGRAGIAALRASLPAGAPMIVDSRFALASLVGVDGATPNLEELVAAAGRELLADDDVASAAEALRRRMSCRFVVATRGSQGSTLVEEGQAAVHLPVYGSDQVADVTGAGDTVLATLALAMAAGASPLEAATLANLAGGIVVTKLGTATVSPAELRRAIELAPFLHD
ncbi:MAG: bifunctional heptose 7-phosphate kinase/heptose 1-phosphate adenyltransferase [Thermoanaerobaculaceae bacterium]